MTAARSTVRRALSGWTGIVLAAVAMLAAPAAASADVVTDWNKTMIEAQVVANTPGPPGSRIAAIVQASVFDALNGISPRYAPVHVAPAAPSGASRSAAVAGAAYEALVAFYPDQKPLLDAQLAISIGMLDASPQSVTDGMNWGQSVADEILAWRSGDGFNAVLPPYVPGSAPGDWVPTPPAFVANPVFRTFAIMTPFGMTSPSEFRPSGPPPLTSAAYAAAFNEVKDMGSSTSTDRTNAQTLTARFWASESPVGIWNQAALRVMAHDRLSPLREARTLALLNMTMADGAIAIWEAKNYFNTWRPITAIQQADTDGNPATSADPTWQPLAPTPPFQEYPSGHAGLSGAGAYLLQMMLGRTSIALTSAAYPGLLRTYPSYSAALDDVADARTFIGFHFRFASVDAERVGWNVARNDLHVLLRPLRHHHRR
jgi:hypothetical protein